MLRSMPAITPLPPGRPSEARERLLTTASAIFYAEGVNSIGVDRIVSEARVTRATFYRHFPSKHDLVLAYLQRVHDAIERRTTDITTGVEPRAALRAIAEDIGAQVRSKGFRGCAFITIAAEFDDTTDPVRLAVAAHRKWFADLIRKAFADAGHPRPTNAAKHFIMLRDGAMVGGHLDDPTTTARTFLRGLEGLLHSIDEGGNPPRR
jgi:AcrR family transcriptional regulator